MSENNDTVEIKLTKGFVAIVDLVDADLAQYNWHVNGKNNRPARGVSIGRKNNRSINKTIWMYRVIMERVANRPLLKKEVVDHINGDILDNRRVNLRLTTQRNNSRNRGMNTNNTSGYKGVIYDVSRKGNAKKWRAQIKVDYIHINLGSFETPELAYEAYVIASKKYFGDYVREV